MSGQKFGRNRHKWAIEILNCQAFEMLLHSLSKPHAAEQPAAADGKIEKRCDAAHGERTGECFQFIELA
ncbi:hypothetical protein D3C87_1887900 [compost metagenome]